MAENESIKETEAIASGVLLNISDDKMTVYLSCTLEAAKNEKAVEAIENRLRLRKITAKVDIGAIKQALDEARKNERDIASLPVARGIEPVKAEDGRMEWTKDYFKEGYYIDPDTRKIDFRQKVCDPSVNKDQLLVKVFRARPGKNGRDVFGNAIVVPPPKDVRLSGGSGVYWSDEQGGYCARSDGRVKLRGHTLDVDEVYYARNGVNAETGNIKHNGQVIVNGEVDSEFKIEATGDIEIRDIAYACDITCGGNLVAKEGINSNPEKMIKVGGDIMAKYLMNAIVRAKGDIVINKEIYQSHIEAKGVITCDSGRIIGGEVIATKGITVGEAGSRGNVKTILAAGIDKDLQAARLANAEEIKRLKAAIKKLEAGHKRFKANLHLLDESQKEAMSAMKDKISDGETEIKRLEAENKRIFDQINSISDAQITIKDIVNQGVILRIAGANYAVNSVLRGPLRAVYDRQKSEVRIESIKDGDGGEPGKTTAPAVDGTESTPDESPAEPEETPAADNKA